MNKKILNNFLKKSLFIKFINFLMISGKKTQAEKIFLTLLKNIKKHTKNNPIILLIFILKNISPLLVLRTHKKRKISRIVPTPLTKKKQLLYGMHNLIKISKKNLTKKMHKQLFDEIINIANNKGNTIQYNQQIYNLAYENKLLIKYNKKIN
jgi:small subunit ribosomal protein S7